MPGFDTQYGLTEAPQVQPGGAVPILHIEGLAITAALDENLGYDTNVNGLPRGSGSGFLETAPSFSVAASGPRGRFALDLTLDDLRYAELARQDRTDWTVSLGTSYALGRDTLVLGYAHLNETEISTDLASVASNSAIQYASDDFRALYQTSLGRLVLTPDVEFTTFRYGDNATGASAAPSLSDYNVTTAGIAALYPFGNAENAELTIQDVGTDYLRAAPVAGSLSSNSWLLLAGIDDQRGGPWRYRLLAGVEQRNYADQAFASSTTPAAEASVTWQPAPLTSITAVLSRQIDNAASAGAGSYTGTDLNLSLQRSLRHDLVLQCQAEFELAEYRAGGTQSNYGAGASLAWTLAPRLRLQFAYKYRTESAAPGAVSGAVSGGFADNRVTLSVHVSP